MASSVGDAAPSGDEKPAIPATGNKSSEDVASLATALEGALLDDESCVIVDSKAAMVLLIDSLNDIPVNPPSLYIDLEGIYLSRLGSLSILQIYVVPQARTYLVDVHVLQHDSFTTGGKDGTTLQDILQSEIIPKVFFDVRNDSDALFSHYRVRLAGVQDLQLMELATRTRSKKFVTGLAKCIEYDCPMSSTERRDWKARKEAGLKLFAPELGGSYEVFNQRPLAQAIKDYCVQDVEILPKLWALYDSRLTKSWKTKVDAATLDRVKLSQTASYNGKGQHMAIGPWG